MTAALAHFALPVADWFEWALGTPTEVQTRGWPPIARGQSTLLLAPTGSGKTLAAFLAGLDRLMFSGEQKPGVKLLYVSPLKALAVDVERNLRAPLAGISAAAERRGVPAQIPSVAIRSGDTPANERARFRRHPTDILITTPESLYLLLTSEAARHLASVETVIVDEIHALVSTKRGAHLALSLERLERLRAGAPLQRVGLSATVRPVEEAAWLLGGNSLDAEGTPSPRPLEIVDAAAPPRLELRVEVPVEDMPQSVEKSEERSIWPAIHGPLVELIRSHRSTLIFVNSRRLAERLSGALNELAGEPLVLAHHGAVARERRREIEDALKAGRLRALVATSSLELGIDMGAIDLVVQIEAPPSVASGLQRVGRAGHQVGGVSRGIVFPKFRGELLAIAATVEQMRKGAVEALHFPRNPLDVLAQQIVAIVSDAEIGEKELYELVRCAAPFARLSRRSFEAVLDLLSGRYPSDEFAELKPRLVWDRVGGRISARRGARRVAIANAGTIPDRGLYGVFLASDAGKRALRVGELDEEMVFESRVGDVFVLGASSWRIDDITYDRVIVSPAPGQPGRMPFWRGDRAGRPLELGRAIGRLSRELCNAKEPAARAELERRGLDPRAAGNLMAYLAEQRSAVGDLPSDQKLIIESFSDELGDFRVCLLSPFGARVHAPWALAAMELQRERLGIESEAVWSDDGIVFRFPEATPPELSLLVPEPQALDELLQRSLAKSSLFAASFRENSARALLLPRKRPGQRTPLWAQRRRAADLLSAASRYPEFPMLLETYRECLSDVFDVPGLSELLTQIARRQVRVSEVRTQTASPFAAALMFSYVGNFLYGGDAPLAERRAHALTIDQAQLRELLGEAELRRLLDPDAIAEVEREVSRKNRRLGHADELHDLLIAVGDLSASQIEQRVDGPLVGRSLLEKLERERRIFRAQIAGEERYAAVEDAARLRDALGVVLPAGLPEALLEPARDAHADLVARFARTHGPFTEAELAARYALAESRVAATLARLAQSGRVVSGEFLPHGSGREWCDAEVLRRIKQRSLARLRRQVEPVEPEVYARFLVEWQGADRARSAPDLVAQVMDQLEGAPLVASALERDVLAARVERVHAADLDALTSSGEFVWRGLEPLGPHDGRIAFYRAEHFALLAPPPNPVSGELAEKLRVLLRERGASFFTELVAATRAFPRDVLETLWDLVWAGEVTNDTILPLRSRLRDEPARERGRRPSPLKLRSHTLPGSEGRWSLLERWRSSEPLSPTERLTAVADVLLERYGVLVREALAYEGLATFSELYPVLKAMEEAGKVRRGYFVRGLAATQFARPGADDRLRILRESNDAPTHTVLAATDPVNPYGAALPWPEREPRPQRSAGARVILYDGKLVGYLSRSTHALASYLPESEPERGNAEAALTEALVGLLEAGPLRAFVISEIDGQPAREAPLARALEKAGFAPSADGLVLRAALRKSGG